MDAKECVNGLIGYFDENVKKHISDGNYGIAAQNLDNALNHYKFEDFEDKIKFGFHMSLMFVTLVNGLRKELVGLIREGPVTKVEARRIETLVTMYEAAAAQTGLPDGQV